MVLVAPLVARKVWEMPADMGGLSAWRDFAAMRAMMHVHGGPPSVIADIHVDEFEPDPHPLCRDWGSVKITTGRIQHPYLRGWVRPVAQQIADRYGVDVTMTLDESQNCKTRSLKRLPAYGMTCVGA